jgi:hypothetical protein
LLALLGCPHLSSKHRLLAGISLASLNTSLFITNSIFNSTVPEVTNAMYNLFHQRFSLWSSMMGDTQVEGRGQVGP